MYAVGAVEYFFMVDLVGFSGVFGMVARVYSCTIQEVAGKRMYFVDRRRLHDSARTDMGGRAMFALHRTVGKLHRFVDTS